MWSFKKEIISKTPAPKPIAHKRVYVVVSQDVSDDDKVISGTALFEGEVEPQNTDIIPVDALGELILSHPRRFGLITLEPEARALLNPKTAQAKRIYLSTQQTSDGWVASIGGLNLFAPLCSCPHNEVSWHSSDPWPNKFRATGLLALKWKIILNLSVKYDSRYPIELHKEQKPIAHDHHGQCDSCCCDCSV